MVEAKIYLWGLFVSHLPDVRQADLRLITLFWVDRKEKETLITSLPIPCIFAMPPFAHRTGSFIPVPANAKDRAACPSPNTSMPAIGLFSIWSHNRVNVFEENLPKKTNNGRDNTPFSKYHHHLLQSIYGTFK